MREMREKISSRVTFCDLARDYGLKQIKETGCNQFICSCPFHDDKNPSFSFNNIDGVYYCHACKAKGNIFTFVEQLEGINYSDAVKLLAAKFNLQSPNEKQPNYNNNALTSQADSGIHWESLRNKLNGSAALQDIDQHQYFQRKNIKLDLHDKLKLYINNKYEKVVIQPMYAVRGGKLELQTAIQYYENGRKENYYGLRIKGSFGIIGCNRAELETALNRERGAYIKCTEGIREGAQIFVAEGISTGDAICQATRSPTVISGGKNNICNVIESLRSVNSNITITVCADKDGDDEQDQLIEKISRYENCYIAFPSFAQSAKEEFDNPKKLSDFWDVNNIYGSEAVQSQLAKASRITLSDPEPEEFTEKGIAEMNIDFLSKNAFTDFVREVARSTETPIEYALFGGLSCISACLLGRSYIEINKDYSIPLFVSSIILGKSGDGKTPVYRNLIDPILKIETQLYKECYQKECKEVAIHNALLDEKIRKIKKDELDSNDDTLYEKLVELEAKKRPEPVDPRIIAEDITPETMGDRLVKQGGKIAIIDHEGGFFNTIAGRYNNGIPNLDIINKGYDGSGLRVNRQNRNIALEKAHVLFSIFVQPQIFSKTKNFDYFFYSGFFARPIFANPISKVGTRTHREKQIDADIKERYCNLIKNLFNRSNILLSLDTQTQERYIDFQQLLENRRKALNGHNDLGTEAAFDGWIEKLKGNIMRIAGLLHIIENADSIEDSLSTIVQPRTFDQATQLAKHLIEHAQSVFYYVGINEEENAAYSLWNYIKNKKIIRFRESELHQKVRKTKRFANRVFMRETLEILVQRNLLIAVHNTPILPSIKGGRPCSQEYRINNKYSGMLSC